MPRNPKFTKEEVLESAFEVARTSGIDSITAQSVAKNMNYTGSSLFTHFKSVEEIKQAVFLKGKNLMYENLSKCMDYTPAFKEFGLRFVQFAIDEPNIFRMLNVDSKFKEKVDIFEEFKSLFEPMYKEIENSFELNEEESRVVLRQCIVMAIGISILFINGGLKFDLQQLGQILSECCLGVVMLLKTKNGTINSQAAELMINSINQLPKK